VYVCHGALHGFGKALLLDHVAVVVTECGTNLLRHATGGELLVRPWTESIGRESRGAYRPGVEILSIDKRPGMAGATRSFRRW
jgi:hypothetical protein